MSSTLLQFRSPSSFVMSQSQLNHSYDTNQTDINHPKMPESKQSHYLNHSQQAITNNNNNDNNNNDDHYDNNKNKNNTNKNISDNPYNHKTNDQFQSHQADKIHLRSTNRSSHHEVSSDNWRIKYYMNLNLVKQPQHISLQYRSSSLPHQTVNGYSQNAYTPPTKLPSQSIDYSYQHTLNSPLSTHQDRARKSIERKHDDDDDDDNDQHQEEDSDKTDDTQLSMTKLNNLDSAKSMDFVKTNKKRKSNKKSYDKIKPNKTIHVVSRTKSHNNTPPRPIASMLKKHHKKSRLSRLRSRSDGMLSFQANKKSSSVDSIEDEDDNDSVSTNDSVNNNINNHHLNAINGINTINNHNLTPPRTSKINKITNKSKHYRPSPNSSLVYQSSRTPPGNNYNNHYMNNNNNDQQQHHHHHQQQQQSRMSHYSSQRHHHHHNIQQRKGRSEPVGYNPKRSQSIAIQRSRPLSINKHKIKPRFDVDFKPSNNSYQSSSDAFFNNLTNPDSLVDDEANFDME